MADDYRQEGTTSFSVRFYNEVFVALEKTAKQQKRSKNFLIHEAVADALGLDLQTILDQRPPGK